MGCTDHDSNGMRAQRCAATSKPSTISQDEAPCRFVLTRQMPCRIMKLQCSLHSFVPRNRTEGDQSVSAQAGNGSAYIWTWKTGAAAAAGQMPQQSQRRSGSSSGTWMEYCAGLVVYPDSSRICIQIWCDAQFYCSKRLYEHGARRSLSESDSNIDPGMARCSTPLQKRLPKPEDRSAAREAGPGKFSSAWLAPLGASFRWYQIDARTLGCPGYTIFTGA